MKQIIREVENPKLADLFRSSFKKETPILHDLYGENFSLLGSGKGALSLILSYLRSNGDLQNKMDEILVPEWLGYWVYNQVNQFAFPTKTLSSKSKAMLVYHQYGFPQNMDRIMQFASENNLIVIEDCAHSIDSHYKGKALGTFGNYAIYSFSKFLFAFAVGGLTYKDKNFEPFLNDKLSTSSNLEKCFINVCKLADEYSIKYQKGQSLTNPFMSMSYALYGQSYRYSSISENLINAKIMTEIKVRKVRYKYFLDHFKNKGICDHLEKEYVTPYVIPIFLKEKERKKVLTELRDAGFKTGEYRFDTNRFFLEPNFETVLWIFCHSGLSDSEFEKQIDILDKYL